MKVEFEALKEAVGRVRGTVATKPAVEAYGWLCFRDGRLSSFDGICGTITNSTIDGLSCCVPFKPFWSMLSTMDGSGIFMETDGWLHVTRGTYKAKIPTHSVFDFPDLMPASNEQYCEASNLVEALQAVAITMEDDDAKRVIFGCGFRGDYVYSTDGKRVTRARLNAPAASDLSIGFAAVRQLIRMGQPAFLFRTDSGLGALYKETKTIVISRMLNTDFPYHVIDKAFGSQQRKEVDIPTDLVTAVERVRAMVSDEGQLNVSYSGGRMRLFSAEEGGQTEETIAFPQLAEQFDFKIKADSIHAALKRLKPKTIDLADVLWGDGRMVVMRGEGYEHLLALMA